MTTVNRLLVILLLIGCNANSKSEKKISNKGTVTTLNGRGQTDTLRYSCDSCFEILKETSVFDTVISIASANAKERLNNKLSFRPISADIKVLRQDSLFYTSGKHIDSLVAVLTKYKCIGKNGYGVENEVESTSIVYLVNNRVTDLEGKIRKEPVTILAGGTVSRNLNLYGDDGIITIQPADLNGVIHLIVTTNESCVENTRLRIGFSDKEEISVSSWNKFNCKSTSYFRLNTDHLELLKSKPIQSVSFSGNEFVFCLVPDNQKDYFMQYVQLIK